MTDFSFSVRGPFMVLLAIAFCPTAARAADTTPPRVEHQRADKSPLNQPFRVRATITDESEIFAPTLYVRAVGQEEFVSIEMIKEGELYQATVPAEQMAGDIEYFIEAFDEHGNGPTRDGSPEAPILVPVFDPSLLGPSFGDPLVAEVSQDDRPITEKWWFWTLIGVAVAGGATAIIIAASSGGADEVNVLVRGPDPSGVLK